MAKNAVDITKELNTGLERSLALTERFADAADKANGKTANALSTMAGIYNKLAKQQAEVLKSEQKRQKLQEDLNKAMEKEKKTKDATSKLEVKQIREQLVLQGLVVKSAKQEVDAMHETVEKLTQKKTLWGEITKAVGRSKMELIGYLGSTASLLNGLRGIAKAAQDVVDIQIQSGSFVGMTGKFGEDLLAGGLAAVTWSKNMTQAKVTLAGLGISAEETGAAFKDMAVLTQDASRQRAMTEATGALSKVLGVSLGESTEYVIEQTQKYNRTAESSTAVMMDLYQNVRRLNDGMGMTVIRGRDVAKLLFDISRESRAVAQDQKAMQQMISGNLINLQAQGRNYKEALGSVSGYIKKMTVDAPDWAKILASRELGKQLKQLGSGTKLGKEMEDELEQASPGIVKRIRDMQQKVKDRKMSSLAADRTIQEWLSETRIGMNVMQEEISKLIKRTGPEAAHALKEMYGVSMSEALDMVTMNEQWEEQQNLSKQMLQNTAKSWEEIERKIGGLNAEEKDMLANKLTGAEREEFIRKRMADREKTALKSAKDAQQASRNSQIKEYENRINQAKKEGNNTLVSFLSEELKSLQDKNNKQLDGITDTITKQLQGLQQILGGGFFKQVGEVIASPIGQIVTGLAGLITMAALQRKANGLLQQIAINTGQGGNDSGIFSSARKRGKGAVKKGTDALARRAARGGFGGALAKGALKLGGGLGKVAGKMGGKMGGILGSLGIEALLNAGSIKDAFANGQNDWGLGGLYSLLANTVGNVGIGSAVGTAAGSFLGPAGAMVGGLLGTGIDSLTGDYNINKLLGVDASTVGKGNAITNASIADLSGMGSSQAAAGGSSSTYGSPNAVAPNSSSEIIQRNGGYDVKATSVTTTYIPFAQALAANNGLASMGGMV